MVLCITELSVLNKYFKKITILKKTQMMKKTILWRCLFCQIFLLSFLSSGIVSAQTGPNDDFDGDGVINSIDIDDDNDGVPDATESPNCYYTANEWNTLAKPTVGVSVTSDLTTVSGLGNFAALGDNNNTVNAVQFVTSPTQTQNNKALFTMTFSVPVQLDAFYIKKSSAVQISGGNLMFEASNDAATWTPLFSAASNPLDATNTTVNGGVSLTNSNKFAVGINAGKYKYYRIRGTTANNVLAGIATEFYFDFNTAAYVASFYPKGSCADANIDNDGILPHFDRDSDGDGCSDAFEAGATTNMSANYQFPDVDANNDGLVDAVDPDGDGIVNYISKYSAYSLNKNVNACSDSDGDGVRDVIDVDDDNDGILDKTECPNAYTNMVKDGGFATASPQNWYLSTAPYAPPGLNVNTYSGTNANSQLTSGLFAELGDDNSNTGLHNIVVEAAASAVYRFDEPFIPGVPYNYSFDLGNRASGSTYDYIVQLYNATTGMVELTLQQADMSTLPAYGSNPSYKKLSGTFTVSQNTQYYLLFTAEASGAGGAERDFLIDRVAVVGTLGNSNICDTDGDGIPNYLDLDSDGDGCSDLAESGVSPVTDVSTPASVNNNVGSSYGIALNKLTGSQLNPNGIDLNNDGLNDSVDPDQNGNPNYNSTYNPYAIGSNYAACADTDGDTILDINDIDDDNDGVLDAMESPACFYTETDAKMIASIRSDLNIETTLRPFENAIDGVNSTSSYTGVATGQNSEGKAVYEISLSLPTAVSNIQFDMYNLAFGNANVTFMLQGFDGSIWVNLETTASTRTVVNAIETFTNSLHPTVKYIKYRVLGINDTAAANNSTGYARVQEIYLVLNNYIPSEYPKPTCTNDPDGDGVPNHRDLDSDGDGCSDSVEAGNTVFTNNNTTTFNTGADANNNGLLNQFESSITAGTINYISTYTDYATNAAISACLDSDGDAVPDITDIDDDNDGVLDVVESPSCAIVDRNDASNVLVWDFEQTLHTLPTTEYNAAQTQPYNVRTFGPGVVDVSGANVLKFTGATAANFDDAVANGDYMQYYFTTTSTYLSIDKIYNYTIQSPLKEGVIISTDPSFATYTVLTTGAATVTGGNIVYNAMDTYSNYPLNLNTRYYVRFIYYGLTGTTASYVDAVGLSFNGISNAESCLYGLDIDNDGIPNRLDLDSDGDDCPDTKEAILYNHSTEASVPGTVKNGSGGAVTSTTPNVPNAMVPGPYGSNGFADVLQFPSNPDAYKHVYTYHFIADAADVSACDNKFLMDIDTDDDGIPDAVESPSCFYTEAQAIDITEAVTSDFTWATANPLSNSYDNNTATTNYGAVTPAVSIQNKALITFDLPVIDAALIDNVKLNVGGVAFGGGKWKLQGLDIDTNMWTDLSDALGQDMLTANSTYTFSNTQHITTIYHSYRILGIDNVNITNNARLIEFTIQYKNFNPSLHRTKTGCNSDNDGDGVPNYVDRDSDGDGCPDAVEAGIDKALLVPANFFNAGGSVPGTYVIVGGNYGDNGIGDNVETMSDSGITNYASTYNQYAINSALNVCTDTDGDGIIDLNDIDDDNDGIVDAVESPACFYTAAEANTITSVTSPLNAAAGDPTANTEIATLHNGNASDTSPYNFVSQSVASGATIFTVTYPTPVTLSSLTVTQIASGMSTNTSAFGKLYGSVDGVSYILLTSGNGIALNTTSVTFANAVSTPYRYYQIRSVGTIAAGNTAAFNTGTEGIQEISSVIAVTPVYLPSAHPKPGICSVDTDGDGVPNHLDLNSDGDGCSDLAESGVSPATDISTPASVTNNNGLSYGIAAFKLSGSQLNPMATDANNDGLNDSVDPDQNGITNYTSTYANAINMAIANCFCYVPAATSGMVLDTPQGITSLGRAGVNADNWPMVRKGAWTALEAKTKGFVPNRLTAQQITDIPAADLKDGMMVYNIDSDCIYINTDGTSTGWKCFNTQACP